MTLDNSCLGKAALFCLKRTATALSHFKSPHLFKQSNLGNSVSVKHIYLIAQRRTWCPSLKHPTDECVSKNAMSKLKAVAVEGDFFQGLALLSASVRASYVLFLKHSPLLISKCLEWFLTGKA